MREKLQTMIADENHKQPLTDTELCKRLSVSREYITLLRKELAILDSRARKRAYICREMKEILAQKPGLGGAQLLSLLKDKGYVVSKYLLDKYLEDMGIRAALRGAGFADEAAAEESAEREYAAFENLVGADGSLQMQIQQAKATMLYPPHGLHCLILGETGVGKSELAEAMFSFAVEAGCLPENAPFVVFNCADYAENSQLLIAQLFGSVKGAYTGAAADKKGLIEQTDGGILFLDEVHRLSPDGQEMLFQLIDKGVYRRLGEADAARQAKVQLIAATTENSETSLLATFKRRIPMLITLPPLMERPLTERMQLISKFFGYESARMQAPLLVGVDVVKAYLLYECKGNIGQLRSDIQVSCAKSFLSYVTKRERVVRVDIHDLNLHVKKGLMKIHSKRREIDSIAWKDLHFNPAQCLVPQVADDDIYSFPREFYGNIEEAHAECVAKGLDVRQIKTRIGDEIERKLQTVISHVKHHLLPLPLDEVSKVVGEDVIALVQDVMRVAERDLGSLDQSIVYCLAIHLNATFARLRQGKKIINPNLEEIRRKFQREYAVAEKMVGEIQRLRGVELPEDEIGYIALYLRGNEKEAEGKVGVVVATHGGSGQSMLEIAGKLLNVNHGASFTMRFEENPKDALDRLTAIVENADAGKGVLMLVDMGSLLTFGEIIQERTKIRVETVERVDTVMVIEALRRGILPGANLRDMLSGIESLNSTFPKTRRAPRPYPRQKAVIALCFTGEGAALHCSRRLKKIAGRGLKDIAILHMGMVGERDIYERMQKTIRQYEVLAIVGSVDPKIPGIPYLPMDHIFSESGARRLLELLRVVPEQAKVSGTDGGLEVARRTRAVMLDDRPYDKEEALEALCVLLQNGGYVKEGYQEAVLAREAMGSCLIRQKVAMPHADSSYVKRPAILLAKARHPIPWDGKCAARLICLLALDIGGKDDVRYLYQKFQDEAVIAGLEAASTEEELREALFYGANDD